MNLKEYELYLSSFLQNYLDESHCKGFVLGVSGGVDSAVVAGLLSKYFKNNHLAIVMPINNQEGFDDAVSVCKHFSLNYKIEDLSKPFNSFELPINSSCQGNLKARLRMTTLYYYAQLNNYLVIGTDNKDEYYTGYFTKYGDGGYDINPLRFLNKSQVKEFAKQLGVEDKIIKKKPSANLISGVNDEDELKVSYEILDSYLNGNDVDENSKNRIEHLHLVSEHKRNLPKFPEEFK